MPAISGVDFWNDSESTTSWQEGPITPARPTPARFGSRRTRTRRRPVPFRLPSKPTHRPAAAMRLRRQSWGRTRRQAQIRKSLPLRGGVDFPRCSSRGTITLRRTRVSLTGTSLRRKSSNTGERQQLPPPRLAPSHQPTRQGILRGTTILKMASEMRRSKLRRSRRPNTPAFTTQLPFSGLATGGRRFGGGHVAQDEAHHGRFGHHLRSGAEAGFRRLSSCCGLIVERQGENGEAAPDERHEVVQFLPTVRYGEPRGCGPPPYARRFQAT